MGVKILGRSLESDMISEGVGGIWVGTSRALSWQLFLTALRSRNTNLHTCAALEQLFG